MRMKWVVMIMIRRDGVSLLIFNIPIVVGMIFD